MKTLYIVRGVPGSGKSTLAKKMAAEKGISYFEADMYFERSGEYIFSSKDLPHAHEWCKTEACLKMSAGDDVIVSNTFTKLWEIEPYMFYAMEFGYGIKIIHCTSEYGSIHGVPADKLEIMKRRFQSNDEIKETIGDYNIWYEVV